MARITDWGNLGWWGRAILAAAWTPVIDLRKGRKWGWDKYQDRKERRRQDEREADERQDGEPQSDQPEIDEPKGDGRQEESEAEQDRQDKPEVQEPKTDERQGHRPKADEPEHGRERQGEEPPEEPWWRRRQRYARSGSDYEVEIEVVRPRPADEVPALERRQPSQAPDTSSEQPLTPSSPSGPVVQVVDAIGVDEFEGTTDMTRYVAIPGASTASRTLAEADGNSHDLAVALAKQIVKTAEEAVTTATDAKETTFTLLEAMWHTLDGMDAARISGPVFAKSAEAAIAFEKAYKTALQFLEEVKEAEEAAQAAERLQSRVGNAIQAPIQAGGKSVARYTRYYFPR
ncbi:hypothetical protein OG339_48145 (plasmid) [Streptosporangium sp. NBC_01495]|uniref:hypothetical protein n=1 Tax=Streptosporangium sp. NBC_01495 TaxID=2903899 RepID=UPI002E31AAAB|nr:hypothetical protein [Streptosporangium sp. NBC_01495]